MAATNFKTENNTFRKLMGNGLTYQIPRFQRDYSWEGEQWEDLWQDILSSLQENEGHYMGYLVLQSNDDKKFDVIDGQQRLTTISIIILTILKNLQNLIKAGDHPIENQQRLEQIHQTYIGYLDPITLVTKSKLTLNRNNNSYYQTQLVQLVDKLPSRGFKSSEHLLRKAFEWFDKQILDETKKQMGDKGVYLATLIEKISDNLFFTVITVSDELNAYRVFETLNARGVQLSSTDLLKNYLFSLLDNGNTDSEHELKTLEMRWEDIINRLQADKFTSFLRIHWNSRHKLSRQSELFKTIRKTIKDRKEVFSLIRGIESDLDAYLNLTSPELSTWKKEDAECSKLLKLFRINQPISLLLAAYHQFDDKDFTKILHAIVIISFRYNVIGGYNPNEQERIYNEIAIKISQQKIKTFKDALEPLKKIYIEDGLFKEAFSQKAISTRNPRGKKIVDYILIELEKQLSNMHHDVSSDIFNIEHILPQNAPDDWGNFSHEEAEMMLYRLGNMTLLHTAHNRELGNESYAEKRKIYEKSTFKMTQEIAARYSEWTPENIQNWQNYLAKQATAIWRISQLDKKA